MTASNEAKKILSDISDSSSMAEIKKIGKEIKKDHDLALELWSSKFVHARLLATLIFDAKRLDQITIERLARDLTKHDEDDRDRISEWLLANQLMKNKATLELVTSWQDHASPTLRRLYWYHQGRLRWTGKGDPGNSAELISTAEQKLATDDPEVQWAMNFCLGWIGIFEPKQRKRCIKLGEQVGLYRDEIVAKNCTPSYLPEFIRIETDKRA